MTETTDIKALREDCTDERMCGACFSGQGICSNQIGCDYLREKLIGIDSEKDLHEFATHVIDRLEAERQRSIKLDAMLTESLDALKSSEAELAALRGTQEPVAWTDAEEMRDVEKHGCGYLFKIDPANPYTDPRRQIMVYRRQPKPVVDDAMALAFHQALNDGGIGHSDLEEIKTGLRAALGVYDSGIVVKDGE